MRSSSLFLGLTPLLSCVSAFTSVSGPFYAQSDIYQGTGFFEKFNFFTDADPTSGYVDYKSEADADTLGLLTRSSTSAKWGVGLDKLDPNDNSIRGRPSVRLESKTSYTKGLFLADIKHMPANACGIWPAFWTLGSGDWPYHGEIDIVEGVNQLTSNKYSLHSGNTACSVSGAVTMAGTLSSPDCQTVQGTSFTNYVGCGIQSKSETNFGTPFNNNGGGTYAMQWTDNFIKIWFFPRGQEPPSVKCGAPDVADFGIPEAFFSGCDIASNFKENRLVFDTTFCGSWAGADGVYKSDACPLSFPDNQPQWMSCKKQVAEHPETFKDGFWEVNSIKIYSETNTAPTCPVSSSSSSIISSTSSAISSSSSSSVFSSTSSVYSSSSSSSVYSSTSSVYSSSSSSSVYSSTSSVYPSSSSGSIYSSSSSSSSAIASPVIPSGSSSSSHVSSSAYSSASSYASGSSSTPSSYSSVSSYSMSSESYPSPSSSKAASSSTPDHPVLTSSTSSYPTLSSATRYYNTSSVSSGRTGPKPTLYSDLSSAYGHGYPSGKASSSVPASPVKPSPPPKDYPIKYYDDPSKVTTVLVTEIVDVCPTGLTTSLYTTTWVYAKPSGSSSASTTAGPKFTTTVKLCTTGCGSKPTSVTVTIPVTHTIIAKKTSSAGLAVNPIAAASALPKCPAPVAIVTVTVTVDGPVAKVESTPYAPIKASTSSVRTTSSSGWAHPVFYKSSSSSTSSYVSSYVKSSSTSSVKTSSSSSSKAWYY